MAPPKTAQTNADAEQDLPDNLSASPAHSSNPALSSPQESEYPENFIDYSSPTRHGALTLLDAFPDINLDESDSEDDHSDEETEEEEEEVAVPEPDEADLTASSERPVRTGRGQRTIWEAPVNERSTRKGKGKAPAQEEPLEPTTNGEADGDAVNDGEPEQKPPSIITAKMELIGSKKRLVKVWRDQDGNEIAAGPKPPRPVIDPRPGGPLLLRPDMPSYHGTKHIPEHIVKLRNDLNANYINSNGRIRGQSVKNGDRYSQYFRDDGKMKVGNPLVEFYMDLRLFSELAWEGMTVEYRRDERTGKYKIDEQVKLSGKNDGADGTLVYDHAFEDTVVGWEIKPADWDYTAPLVFVAQGEKDSSTGEDVRTETAQE